MIVRHRMKSPAITVGPNQSLDAARELLQRHRIRQLPVADKGRLVGIVTDRDLRGVHPPGATVKDIMTADPLTVSPSASVDEAARQLRLRKIGALPVLEDGDLVGIITATDILDAFIDLSGVGEPTYRLVISGARGRQAENRIRQLIEGVHGDIHWMKADAKETSKMHVRVKARRVEDIVTALEAAGFDVPSVVAPSASRA